MKIVNPENSRENWFTVLAHWNKVANWSHYELSNHQLKQYLKPLITSLWNEKDWMKKRYPGRGKEIEEFINQSKHLKVIADLANSIKHGGLDYKPRSNAKQTDYFGRITLNQNKSREMYYIEIDGKIVELFQILRGALDEYELLDNRLAL
ncbi:hypothetical protein [Saccharophagus degradans]|uniref:Uncharacterized protein n=1 Tax=Saccharophagus degradans (strain 2-40 / ATCC 43961 / DSM 17024) TaxID=203122 RepID=Q21I76_SACD2|nr:hypothetical protein [Saccharophagus degradans]ABD81603.1 hypothetical protein Sde_2343 [Saccharophagus degradans 2-40]